MYPLIPAFLTQFKASGGTREISHGAEPFTGSASRLRFVIGRIFSLHSGWICEAGFRLVSHGTGDIPLDAGPVRSSCMHACMQCDVLVPGNTYLRRHPSSHIPLIIGCCCCWIAYIYCIMQGGQGWAATYNRRMLLSRKQSVRRGPTKAGFGLLTPSSATHSACSTPNYMS